jgi:hypothetical protein
MIRITDLIGLAGFALVAWSTLLLFPDSAEGMNWVRLVGGVALWLAGFASVIVWIWSRWLARKPKMGSAGYDAHEHTAERRT